MLTILFFVLYFIMCLELFSADEVGEGLRFPLRQTVFFLGVGNGFDEETHVAGEGAHHLHAFSVLFAFSGTCAVDAVPVLTGGNRHAGDGEKFVQFVKGGGEPSSAG